MRIFSGEQTTRPKGNESTEGYDVLRKTKRESDSQPWERTMCIQASQASSKQKHPGTSTSNGVHHLCCKGVRGNRHLTTQEEMKATKESKGFQFSQACVD